MLKRFSVVLALTLAAPLLSACGDNAADKQAAKDNRPFTLLAEADVATARTLEDTALAGNPAWDLLESLTTEIGPRLAGSPANARAVEWALDKFKTLGFDKVWTEPVTIHAWKRIDAEARILSPYPHEFAVTSLGLSTSTPGAGIEGEVMQFKTIADLQAAPADAAAGKIVFISNRMQRTRDGSGYGPAVAARSNGASEAGKRGALAVIIRSIGTDSHRLPHTGAMRYAKDDTTRIPAAALSNPDADILENALRRGKPIRLYLKIINQDLGEVETVNVIGQLTGSEKPDEVVVIGGHLDSWDLGTGAIDDGAGVAITMAAGHLISQLETRPRRSLRVIAFAAEEIGLYGGRAYAKAHESELGNHIIGAESDFGAGRIYALSPKVAESALPVMAEITRVLAPLGIEAGNNDGEGGPDMSAMSRKGVPMAGLRQDGTSYFDLHHTADDTFDKVEKAALEQNVAAYAAFSYLALQYDGRFDGK